MSERFHVDLGGMVDLLSRHLYSGPQVYLRELIQNAVDAVTARRELDPDVPARIRLSVDTDEQGHPSLLVEDTGIGLSAQEATELLATIGRSSKRDPVLGLGRSGFIGQFGIGLLAAFMVADRIEVRSLSARPGSVPIRWIGYADGTFEVSEDPDPAAAIGTRLTLIARRDAAHWLSEDAVLGLALDYASLLPFDIAMKVAVEGSEPLWRRITEPELPWKRSYSGPAERATALAEYCERTFGFAPLAHIDLSAPAAGISGVAFVLPQAVSPASGQHRVYMKRMLLGPRVDRILPEWAFFTRAVVDAEALSPTASREQLHDDEILLDVREALGAQLKEWARDTLRTPNGISRRVLETHHLALRAVALSDPDMLDLVAEVLPFETTHGPMSLTAAADGGELVYTSTTEAYRRVAAVARAQGLVVVNAGYVYDSDILERLAARSGWRVRELKSADLMQVLEPVDLAREMELAEVRARARELLSGDDCEVLIRRFEPGSVAAVLLRDPEGEHRRELDREREASPELWGGLLDAFAEPGDVRTRTLVLNDDAPLARRLLSAPPGEVFAAGLRSLYLSAAMLAGEGLRSEETAALGDALGVLLDAALDERRHEDPLEEGHA